MLTSLEYFSSEEYKKDLKKHFKDLKNSGAYDHKTRQLCLSLSLICCDR
jgi:hypothetical protein